MTIDAIMNPIRPTAAQVNAAFALTLAVAETIRECGEAPAGTIYAALIGRVSLEGFQKMIQQLKNAGLVSESSHMLKWTGPALEGRK